MASNDLLHPSVRRRLGSLRTSLRGRLLCEGLAWLALAAVAAVLATLGLDYVLRLERGFRILFAALAAAGLGVVVWRQMVRPLRVPMDVPAMALLIENRFRNLADRLITAVEFSSRPPREEEGVSLAMVRHAGDEANQLAGVLDFREVVERPRMRQMGLTAAAAAMLLAGFSVWQGWAMALWFQRSVLFQNVDWPQRTYLRVVEYTTGDRTFRETNVLRVVRGDDMEVFVEADGDPNVQVMLHAKFANKEQREVRMKPVTGQPRRFSWKFDTVSEPFSFYVAGGDDELDRRTNGGEGHLVQVVDPPSLSGIRFQVEHRAYMKRKVESFYEKDGVLPVTPGCTLRIDGKANKDIKSAWIVLDDKDKEPLALRVYDTAVPKVGTAPREVRGEVHMPPLNSSTTRSLKIVLAGVDGTVNRRGQQFVIQVQPDLAASIEVRKRAVGAVLTPQAFFPVILQVKDDYGASEANFVVTCKGHPRYDVQVENNTIPTDLEFRLEREVDIKSCGFKPGDVIQVFAEVRDNMPEDFLSPPTEQYPAGAPGPNLSISGLLEFRIVTPEELREDLVRRLKEARIEFDEAIKMQETSRARGTSARQLAQDGKAGEETKALLTEGSKLQAAVGGDVAKTAETLAAILEEMEYNFKNNQTDRQAIADIATKVGTAVIDLKDLSKPIRDVSAQLLSQSLLADAAQLADRLEPTLLEQARIKAVMDEIRGKIYLIETRQETEKELLRILGDTERLKKMLEQLGGVGDLFTKPATQPTTGSGAGARP